eukprot:548048_1
MTNKQATTDLFFLTIWTLQSIVEYLTVGQCGIEKDEYLYSARNMLSTADFSSLALHHKQSNYPSTNGDDLCIKDQSTSYNDTFPYQHHLIRSYPQYFVWLLQQCDGIEVLKRVAQLKNNLNAIETIWIKDTWNDIEMVTECIDDVANILGFVAKYDVDEKECQCDLICLEHKIETVENELNLNAVTTTYFSYKYYEQFALHVTDYPNIYLSCEVTFSFKLYFKVYSVNPCKILRILSR